MGRIITILCVAVLLTACGPKRVSTVYTKEYIPVNVVPAPPEVERPTLETSLLTGAQKEDDGELVKGYKISLIQTIGYIGVLEKIIMTYDAMAKESQKDFNLLSRFSTSEGIESGPFSVGNASDVEFVDVLGTREFNFEYEMRNWNTEEKFKKLQKEINTLNDKNYLPED